MICRVATLTTETMKVLQDMLSPVTRCLRVVIYGAENHILQSKKLVPHLGSRQKYVLHYWNLKQYLSLRMQLTHVHCVLTFHLPLIVAIHKT